MKRGNFLLGTISGLTVSATTNHVFARALAQTPLAGLPGTQGRCLVVINLAGGNDGLNCIVPHGDAQYYRLRPSLAIPQSEVIAIDSHTGLNPKMTAFKSMYDKGMVAIVQGVGYPDPNYSHFRSTEIWQTAAPDRYEHTGWLGRYFDEAGLPSSNLFNGVAISQTVPEVLASNKTDIPAIPSPAGYHLAFDRSPALSKAYGSGAADRLLPFKSPYLAHVMEIEDHAQRGSQELPKLIGGYKTDAPYPATALGRSLALAAQIVGSNLGTRVIYVEHASFDTHSNQRPVQDRMLAQFSDAVAAFYQDLAAHGNDKRVLTMTFSEFGRRIEENASHGTDHGQASPLFLIGGGVKGGLYGHAPDLVNLDNGNLRWSTDFRSVYATVLERWLGRPASPVLGGAFPVIPVIA
ncbi:MAG TPA: DUF1501 domain-containing protein [Candidatus Baltobacteraceae bacterium]|nr:DUF1501 domain-containing protein [Candidatus Baltobacteraceae bacterium]